MSDIEAVIWDFGGVITSSPFQAFNRYERDNGLPEDFIRMTNAHNPDDNAWALFERAEVSAEEFDTLFAAETEARGHRVPGRYVLALLAGDVRPEMVEALKRIATRMKVGCITNNVKTGTGAGMARSETQAAEVVEIMQLFDIVVESSKVGVRKPDPAIYHMALRALSVAPERAVYLDDLGINLKPAAALGMKTIKVGDPVPALDQLQELVGFSLR